MKSNFNQDIHLDMEDGINLLDHNSPSYQYAIRLLEEEFNNSDRKINNEYELVNNSNEFEYMCSDISNETTPITNPITNPITTHSENVQYIIPNNTSNIIPQSRQDGFQCLSSKRIDIIKYNNKLKEEEARRQEELEEQQMFEKLKRERNKLEQQYQQQHLEHQESESSVDSVQYIHENIIYNSDNIDDIYNADNSDNSDNVDNPDNINDIYHADNSDNVYNERESIIEMSNSYIEQMQKDILSAIQEQNTLLLKEQEMTRKLSEQNNNDLKQQIYDECKINVNEYIHKPISLLERVCSIFPNIRSNYTQEEYVHPYEVIDNKPIKYDYDTIMSLRTNQEEINPIGMTDLLNTYGNNQSFIQNIKYKKYKHNHQQHEQKNNTNYQHNRQPKQKNKSKQHNHQHNRQPKRKNKTKQNNKHKQTTIKFEYNESHDKTYTNNMTFDNITDQNDSGVMYFNKDRTPNKPIVNENNDPNYYNDEKVFYNYISYKNRLYTIKYANVKYYFTPTSIEHNFNYTPHLYIAGFIGIFASHYDALYNLDFVLWMYFLFIGWVMYRLGKVYHPVFDYTYKEIEEMKANNPECKSLDLSGLDTIKGYYYVRNNSVRVIPAVCEDTLYSVQNKHTIYLVQEDNKPVRLITYSNIPYIRTSYIDHDNIISVHRKFYNDKIPVIYRPLYTQANVISSEDHYVDNHEQDEEQ
jgi:hypothetical protein